MKKKNLGEVPEPWQFSKVGRSVAIKDSLEAQEYFELYYPKRKGIVIPVILSLNSVQIPKLLVWAYLDVKKQEFVSMTPVFHLKDPQILNAMAIQDMKPVERTILCYWRNVRYCMVVTSNGHFVMKKMRSTLSETDMCSILMEDGVAIEDIYPVDIYSHTLHKYVAVCWSVEEADTDMIYWIPVCTDDAKALDEAGDPEDLEEFPINIGEHAVIGGETFEVKYSKELGCYFERTKFQIPMQYYTDRIPCQKKTR
jgi:hypothetical protein